LAWAPLGGPAIQNVERLVLYMGTLLLAIGTLRARGAQRAVEPALAAGATIVIGYGLAGRLLPGVLHFAHSQRAGGRLEQPITYWNAEGALAAVGLVLCARVAGDRSRPAWMRGLAGAATAPLGGGVYLSYSRGAIAAGGVGLVVGGLREKGRPVDATAARLTQVSSNRYDYWRLGLRAFRRHPLDGLGSGGFRVFWLRERPITETVQEVHSLELEMVAELGLVGLLAFGLMVGGVVAAGRRAL